MEKLSQTIQWCSPSGALEKDCKLASIMGRILLLDQARMETKLGRQSPTSIWANSRGKVQEKQPMTVEASLVTLLLTVMLLQWWDFLFCWISKSDLGYYAEKLTLYFSIRKKSFQGPAAGNKCRTGHHWRQRKQTEAVFTKCHHVSPGREGSPSSLRAQVPETDGESFCSCAVCNSRPALHMGACHIWGIVVEKREKSSGILLRPFWGLFLCIQDASQVIYASFP